MTQEEALFTQALSNRFEAKGLLPSTQEKYESIIRSAGADNLLDWVQEKLEGERTLPIGTVLPIRAAIKHYLIAEQGYGEEELEGLLPKAQGLNTKFRDGLNADQLGLYHSAVDRVVNEPARTILRLLPKTGLRISEICNLSRFAVQGEEGSRSLRLLSTTGEIRDIPLIGSADLLLTPFLEKAPIEGWLFMGYEGRPICPHAIRKYTRSIAAETPELAGLTPQTLRHTFAQMALAKGVPLEELRKILGHSSLETTRRYQKTAQTDDLTVIVS